MYKFEPIDYLTNGKNCIYTAEKLKNGPDKIETNYPMRILLVHGVELLLKAFIQHFDKSKFKEIKIEHDIEVLHKTAEEINNQHNLNIFTSELNNAVSKITTDYYPDSVKARYQNTDSRLDFSVFMILRELLIQPLKKIIHL